jgi:hypothetical protein
MTKEEIIELARQAGVRDDEHTFEFSQYKYLERFARLVAEHEREMCAKEAERTFYSVQAAENIRARGQE